MCEMLFCSAADFEFSISAAMRDASCSPAPTHSSFSASADLTFRPFLIRRRQLPCPCISPPPRRLSLRCSNDTSSNSPADVPRAAAESEKPAEARRRRAELTTGIEIYSRAAVSFIARSRHQSKTRTKGNASRRTEATGAGEKNRGERKCERKRSRLLLETFLVRLKLERRRESLASIVCALRGPRSFSAQNSKFHKSKYVYLQPVRCE